jgi:drug/metabolite transporter (DMT)-like permease
MLGAVVYALWMRPGWPTREAAAYNGLRALLIVVTATSFFFALGRLPLADAIAMSFISPALTALLGPCCWAKDSTGASASRSPPASSACC